MQMAQVVLEMASDCLYERRLARSRNSVEKVAPLVLNAVLLVPPSGVFSKELLNVTQQPLLDSFIQDHALDPPCRADHARLPELLRRVPFKDVHETRLSALAFLHELLTELRQDLRCFSLGEEHQVCVELCCVAHSHWLTQRLVQCAETMVSPLKFKEAKADGGRARRFRNMLTVHQISRQQLWAVSERLNGLLSGNVAACQGVNS